MTVKRFSLRFNLENEADKRAWDSLQCISDSRNKTIISAINAYFEQGGNLEETIRETIRECLKDISFVQKTEEEPATVISEDEAALMDSLDLFR